MLRRHNERRELEHEVKRARSRLASLKRKFGAKSIQAEVAKRARLVGGEAPNKPEEEGGVFVASMNGLVPALLDFKEAAEAAKRLTDEKPPKSKTLATHLATLYTGAERLTACLEVFADEHDRVAARVDALETTLLDYTYRLALAQNPLLAEPLLVYGESRTLPPYQNPQKAVARAKFTVADAMKSQ